MDPIKVQAITNCYALGFIFVVCIYLFLYLSVYMYHQPALPLLLLRPRLYLCSMRLSFSLSFCVYVSPACFTATTRLLQLLPLSRYLAVMSWCVISCTTCLLWLAFPHFPARHHLSLLWVTSSISCMHVSVLLPHQRSLLLPTCQLNAHQSAHFHDSLMLIDTLTVLSWLFLTLYDS
jgi:hypothetical protein